MNRLPYEDRLPFVLAVTVVCLLGYGVWGDRRYVQLLTRWRGPVFRNHGQTQRYHVRACRFFPPSVRPCQTGTAV